MREEESGLVWNLFVKHRASPSNVGRTDWQQRVDELGCRASEVCRAGRPISRAGGVPELRRPTSGQTAEQKPGHPPDPKPKAQRSRSPTVKVPNGQGPQGP